jgi:protein-S-isoprenylcysteine O-methyltransferase Ste14
MVLFWIGFVCIIILASFTLWRVAVDYKHGAELSPITVALVWTLYLVHFALELFAALKRYYPIRIAEVAFIVLGAILALAGTTLYILGLLHLGSIRRMSGVDTSLLITGGIYSWSRNPQNVEWILFLFGIGFIARSALALLLALLFTLLFALYVPMEENHLESIYGEEYRKYKKNSHRYFGLPQSKDAS